MDQQITLDDLERGVGESGFRRNEIPLPIAAALLILDIQTGRNTLSGYNTPAIGKVITYIQTHLSGTLHSTQLEDVRLANSVKEIDTARLYAQLSRCTDKGDEAGLKRIWSEYQPRLLGEDRDLAKRDEVWAKILSACLRCERNFTATRLKDTTRDINSSTPIPFPTPILNVLLAHRANFTDSERSTKDEEGIDGWDREGGSPHVSVLRQTWATAKYQGATMDVRSYMIYMEGLGKAADIEGLQEAWNELVLDKSCQGTHQGSYPPIIAFNHMLSCALLVSKTGPPVALDKFDQAIQNGTEINIVTINTILRHHARMADIPAMNSLFSLASKKGLQPDVVTYTTLVQGLLRAERVDMAKNVLSKMLAQGLEPNERMCSLLVADLARTGSQTGLQRAEEMMSEMRRKGMLITQVTWTSLISGYFKGGWDQDAWAAVDRMKRGGWALNRVGYNMILKQGSGRWSVRMMERMIDEGVLPNSDTFAIVLMPLVTSEQWDEAGRVVNTMREMGFRAEKGALARLVRKVDSRR